MYQEIKTNSLETIVAAIKAALARPELLQIDLRKIGNDYEAKISQVTDEEEEAI